MAMAAAEVLSPRVLLTLGAAGCMIFGYKGSILIHQQNLTLSDVVVGIKSLLKKIDGNKDGESEIHDPIAPATKIRLLEMEVKKLSMEVNRLAILNRPVTYLHGGSMHNGAGLSSLVIPAAAMGGALGYGYMKWKGITFLDLMYVTKQNMNSAVANVTKHLEDVSEALGATKRYLTKRIENLGDKVDKQVEISKLIKDDIFNVRDDISKITYSLDAMEKQVYVLSNKMQALDDKQRVVTDGVVYLCELVDGKIKKLPERIQTEINVRRRSMLWATQFLTQGLELALELQNSNIEKNSIPDGVNKCAPGIDIS